MHQLANFPVNTVPTALATSGGVSLPEGAVVAGVVGDVANLDGPRMPI
jgi:hypothetical protein